MFLLVVFNIFRFAYYEQVVQIPESLPGALQPSPTIHHTPKASFEVPVEVGETWKTVHVPGVDWFDASWFQEDNFLALPTKSYILAVHRHNILILLEQPFQLCFQGKSLIG